MNELRVTMEHVQSLPPYSPVNDTSLFKAWLHWKTRILFNDIYSIIEPEEYQIMRFFGVLPI